MAVDDLDDDDMHDDDGGRREGETDEDAKARKRKERLEQNRISARESRKRKKTMIEELQRTVITLSRENKELNERNESLRRQLMEIGSKYPNIVPLQAIVGQAAAPAGGGADAPMGGAGATGAAPSSASTTEAAATNGTTVKAEAASPPAAPASALSGLNPMNWISGGGNNTAGGNSADV